MQKDIRETMLYGEAEALYRTLRQPGTGQISDAVELHASPDGSQAVFAGTIVDRLQGSPPTRLCRVNLKSGDTQVVSFGPNTDRLPKYSPVGNRIAFLSDRHHAGDFQLYLFDPISGAARSTPPVQGWVEYFHWSPDGKRILLAVAGHGADIAGGQGAVTTTQLADQLPSWMPLIQTTEEDYMWRRVWVYELAKSSVSQVTRADLNVWEAVWCGNSSLAVVASSAPGEGLWYSARLHVVDIDSGNSREVFAPRYQVGWPASSPSGKHLVFVEAICSDRWLVAGDLSLMETGSGKTQKIDTHNVDVTYTEWRSEHKLLLAGHRGFESVVGTYDPVSGIFSEAWASKDITTGGRYITVSGVGDGDFVLVGESYTRAPEIATVRQGTYQAIRSFDLGYADQAKAIDAVECLSWRADDGLEIQGWLLRPKVDGPRPLVMTIHGGPVWHWRPMWLGRFSVFALMLVQRGYAVFFPNPRGSAGRGQEFVRHVLGDMGGADTYDYLSGLDHLVQTGVADPQRLGVTGGSYGGFMTSWLITQDARFAAAVSLAPVTNWVTEHLVSNIPHFVSFCLADTYNNSSGKYFQRSPVMHTGGVKTPTLNICGALDRCTPPEEAVQFHSALVENGVTSVLVTYPEEGHGIRSLPAAIDYTVRLLSWFEEHMRPDARRS